MRLHPHRLEARNIRNEEAERLASRLARLTGETKTDGVRDLDLFIARAGIELVALARLVAQYPRWHPARLTSTPSPTAFSTG